MRIYQWYRQLLTLEQNMIDRMDTGKQKELLARLDKIEQAVNNMKVPASFADQFYVLRGHVGFVRARLLERATTRRGIKIRGDLENHPEED